MGLPTAMEAPSPPPDTGRKYPYDAFLSYSSRADYERARRIEAFLESIHKTPAASGVTVPPLRICRDGSDFRLPRSAEESLPQEDEEKDPIWKIIRAELAKSRGLLVLCSPESTRSDWVSKEVGWFRKRQEEEKDRIILPVVTGGQDPSGDPKEVFPQAVRDANLHTQTIWYDLRALGASSRPPGVKDPEDELVRLASDLLGWDADRHGPLSTLWEREQLKRRRRQAAWLISIAAVLIVLAVVAVWQAVLSKRESRRARANAVVLSADAESDPVLAALLIAELADEEEPEQGLRVAQKIVSRGALPRAILRGHTRRPFALSFTPDGRHIFSASVDGSVRLWPVDGRGDPQVFAGHGEGLVKAVLSPDGRWIATGTEKGGVRIWRVGVPKVQRRLLCGRGVVDLSFDSESSWLACVSQDGDALLWRIQGADTLLLKLAQDRKVVRVHSERNRKGGWLAGRDGSVWTFSTVGPEAPSIRLSLPRSREVDELFTWFHTDSIVFSPDGSKIAFFNEERLLVQSTDGSQKPRRFPHRGHVNSVEFSRDGLRLLTACSDGRVRIWSLIDDSPPRELTIGLPFGRDEPLSISSAWFSPRGTWVAAVDESGATHLWDITGQAARRFASTAFFLGAEWGDFHLKDGAQMIAFSEDDRWWVTDRYNLELAIWPLLPPQESPRHLLHPGAVEDVSFSSDGTKLVTAGRDGVARLWRVADGVLLSEVSAQAGQVVAAAFDRSADKIVTAYKEGLIRVWSIRKGRPMRLQDFRGHAGRVLGALFTPDSQRVVSWSEHSAKVWPAQGTGQVLVFRLLSPAPGVAPPSIECADLSRDGSRLALGGSDGKAWVWPIDGSGPVIALAGLFRHTGAVTGIAFDPEGSRILTVSQDNTARIWRANGNGEPVRFSGAHEDSFSTGIFSPDGRSFLTGSFDGRAWLWPAYREGKPRALQGSTDLAHSGTVTSVAFDPAGEQVATSGGMDGIISVWDGESLKRRTQYEAGGSAFKVVFSPDGSLVAQASEGGYATVSSVRWRDLARSLRGSTTATLTPQQRTTFLGEAEDEALRAYERAERQYSRTPLPEGWKLRYPF